MPVVIPNRTDVPKYTLEVALDNVTFRLGFHWNDRAGAWFMSIADVNGTPLLSGRRVVVGFPLISRFRDPRLPAGDFNAVDTSGQKLEAGPNDLGDRVRLLYFSRSELPAALVAS